MCVCVPVCWREIEKRAASLKLAPDDGGVWAATDLSHAGQIIDVCALALSGRCAVVVGAVAKDDA